MLKELGIKNFAIIDQLRVEFGPGLNVFTGETGAGKSIVVDALNLALGERASGDLIRTGSDEAVVEAAFELNSHAPAAVRSILREQGIDLGPGEDLVVRRVISAGGKNKVYVNGSLATLATLSAIGAHLADIHGQHEHQSLLAVEQQLDLLDAYGGLLPLRSAFADLFRRYHGLRSELAAIEAGEREKAQREDLLRYQASEIEGAKLTAGEDDELAAEQRVLANAEKLAGLAAAADDALYASDGSVLAGLRRALTGLRDIAAIDASLAGTFELLESGRAQIEEAAREVSAYAERVQVDPARLEAVGDRIELLRKLKKKYGATIADVAAFGARAAAELAKIERSGEERERLRGEIAALREQLTAMAKEFTRKRTAAGRELEKKVEAELGRLGMKKSRFVVAVGREPGDDTIDGLRVTASGADRIEFLLSANPGEEPRPLARTASGGELSRIMLALKTILIEGDPIPTVVFDEVDAGIGGAVAEEVGRKLRKIASRRQVFCITHLPQIACMATTHYGVAKSVKKDRTSAEVRRLDPKERVDEVARMLGGRTITEATLRHAEEMIGRAREA
jgi:DNA repair protein RecN (Recombination protein N)